MPDNQKQTVQWFPGHMAKTRRKIKEMLPLVDVVTVLLDARIPQSSQNPELEELIGSKPVIYLLNKCDLADSAVTVQWCDWFRKNGDAVLPVDCRTGKGLNRYRDTVKEVLADRIHQNSERGMPGKPLRVMVVGIPNTGKSSFINRMAHSSKAKVEDRAGVTRSNQWFVIGGGIELLDTPGVLWPKFDDPAVGDKLAFTGGVKDQVVDVELLAMRLLAILADSYPDMLAQRYRMTDLAGLTDYEMLELLGRKRGMLMRGGEVDTLRAATTLLDEFRAGKLGKLSFERPPKEEQR